MIALDGILVKFFGETQDVVVQMAGADPGIRHANRFHASVVGTHQPAYSSA